MFHGSYRPEDVTFLLKPIQLEFMDEMDQKEVLIQTGRRHYSEMLSSEIAPSSEYLRLFHTAHQHNLRTLATNCILLAKMLLDRYGDRVTIVSLARAGTPIGAIVHRLITNMLGGHSTHYSVSIIRDRGIDTVAIQSILDRGHLPEQIAFVDGWTGKGVISRELHSAVKKLNDANGFQIDSTLNVLTDLAGSANAASSEDYLISSSILNSTVSGLISRSVLNEQIGPCDYHGCVYFGELEAYDLSQWFVDDVLRAAVELLESGILVSLRNDDKEEVNARSVSFMELTMETYGVKDSNLIKPGLGESTRVLLRRRPAIVIVKNPDDPRVAHLLSLANDKRIPVQKDIHLPYHAVSIIRNAAHA